MRFQPPYHVEGHGLPNHADEFDLAEDAERKFPLRLNTTKGPNDD